MQIKLIVSQEFGPYAKGSEITDQDVIAEILDSEQATYVVKVEVRPDPVAEDEPPAA